MGGIEPETISYVEAHGTATELGDPIEVAALTKAFQARTRERGFCAIGSVKSNIGHLDAAAGVAGLIKTVLALEHGLIPPSLHFASPNPRIDFSSSPFFVNAALQPWARGPHPRRAGVSSFGIGGTNAHVVLEEAPPPPPATPAPQAQLLTLSARTPAALEQSRTRLASHLLERPDTEPGGCRLHPPAGPPGVRASCRGGMPQPSRGSRRSVNSRGRLPATTDDRPTRGRSLGRLPLPGSGLAVREHGPGPLRE